MVKPLVQRISFNYVNKVMKLCAAMFLGGDYE